MSSEIVFIGVGCRRPCGQGPRRSRHAENPRERLRPKGIKWTAAAPTATRAKGSGRARTTQRLVLAEATVNVHAGRCPPNFTCVTGPKQRLHLRT
jgi:hypothetical protein